jgi:NAD(P)-dependent dehydrogenase (short-subunit alcohol dehydrogenase family)
MQFGTNHMGHALLTKLLLPVMERTAKDPKANVRIINLSSEALKWAPGDGILFSQLKTGQADIGTTTRYAQSKLANLYHAEALAKRYPSIISVAVHPGVVATNITGNFKKGHPLLGWLVETVGGMVLANPKTGALTQLWAATTKSEDVKNGSFYYPVGVSFTGKRSSNADEQVEQLWDWTEKELNDFLG